MMDIPLEEPKEFRYNKEHIKILFSGLETDYYNRFEFNDL